MAIRLENNNGEENKKTFSTSKIVRPIKLPECLEECSSEVKKKFGRLDAFIQWDDKKGLDYSELLNITSELFNSTPSKIRLELLKSLTERVEGYLIQKPVDKESGQAMFIDQGPKIVDGIYEQNRLVQATPGAVQVKINMLNRYLEWIVSEKATLTSIDIDQMNNNVFDYEYNGMFAVSPLKGNFSAEDLQSVTSKSQNKERHKYDLKNLNIYHEVTGELLQTAKQHEYNTDFLLTLKGLYVLDVEDFLNHQYKNSGERNKFLQYVKFVALNSEIIKGEATKAAIRDWLETDKEHTPINTEKFEFQNNFDDTQLNVVYEHFKHRVVDKGYLTLETLHSFLKMAFEERKKPTEKIPLKGHPEKQTIRRIFYSFYSEAAGKPHREKLRYASLLGDYFLGYDTGNIMTNFSK